MRNELRHLRVPGLAGAGLSWSGALAELGLTQLGLRLCFLRSIHPCRSRCKEYIFISLLPTKAAGPELNHNMPGRAGSSMPFVPVYCPFSYAGKCLPVTVHRPSFFNPPLPLASFSVPSVLLSPPLPIPCWPGFLLIIIIKDSYAPMCAGR